MTTTTAITTTTRTTDSALRRPAAILLSAVGALALTVAVPAGAEAHVEIEADRTVAGSYALLTLDVPHGCEGSPTTRVAVRIPRGINAVTPTVNPGWRVAKTTEKLADPITDDDGETITSRVSTVVWTARTPLPDGYRDSLSLQVLLPPDAAGQQLSFPTVQTCAVGENGWTQIPAEGQDHDELEHPAPTIAVTAADAETPASEEHSHAGDTHAAGATDDATSTHGGADDPAPDPAPDAAVEPAAMTTATAASSRAGLAGVVLGALGLLAGGTALVRSRGAARGADRG